MSDFEDALTQLRLALKPFRALLEIEEVLNTAAEARRLLGEQEQLRDELTQDIEAKRAELTKATDEAVYVRRRADEAIDKAQLEHKQTIAAIRGEHEAVTSQHAAAHAELVTKTTAELAALEDRRQQAEKATQAAERTKADTEKTLAKLRDRLA